MTHSAHCTPLIHYNAQLRSLRAGSCRQTVIRRTGWSDAVRRSGSLLANTVRTRPAARDDVDDIGAIRWSSVAVACERSVSTRASCSRIFEYGNIRILKFAFIQNIQNVHSKISPSKLKLRGTNTLNYRPNFKCSRSKKFFLVEYSNIGIFEF